MPCFQPLTGECMKIDRRRKIHETLKERHNISINELCDMFGVSKNTIRRDIADLEEKGIIEKVYGGIVLAETPDDAPEPFAFREARNLAAKKLIGRLAAAQVTDGDVIYIDSGTTTVHMIPYLLERKRLTIVTASVHVINMAASYNRLNVISTGGTFYAPSMAFVGPQVIECLHRYNVTKTFLASTGLSLEHGATNTSPLECEIKQCMMHKDCPHFLLVDSSKFDHATLMSYAPLKDLDYIITNEMPPEKYVRHCAENDVQLIVPTGEEL